MADPFIAEIRVFGFDYAPRGWAFCNGQTPHIAQNTALFSLVGTTYGGDGRSTFGLPNLQGSAAICAGQGSWLSQYDLGQVGGTQTVTLTPDTMAFHNHPVGCDSASGGVASPAGNVWGATGRGRPSSYSTDAPIAPMSGQTVEPNGSGQSHNNMPPYLVLNFCIALMGVFPQRP